MRDWPQVAVRLVVAVTGVAIVVAVVLTLRGERSHVVATNGISPVEFAVQLGGGEHVCDPTVAAPAGTDDVRLTIGTYGRPQVPVRIAVPGHGAGRTVRIAEGVVELPVPAGSDGAPGICVENLSRRRIALAGASSAPGLLVGDRPTGGVISIAYLDDDPGDWGDAAGTVLDQIGYAKGVPVSGAAGVIVVLLLVAALGGALASAWRFLRP